MITVEYDDQVISIDPSQRLTIGREGDLRLTGNPYLHRHFLEISAELSLWWLANVGHSLSATVFDTNTRVQFWLSPGVRLPLVFEEIEVLFTAGPCSYTIRLRNDQPIWNDSLISAPSIGDTTIEACPWTDAQRLAILVLAEPMLRRDSAGIIHIPTNAEAAERIGWPLKRFERKIDNICDKLDRLGVDGLRGGVTGHASSRRSRLVEWAVSTGLVGTEDLKILTNLALITED